MKAAVYYNNRDVRIEEIPKPKAEAGEILVKVMASGICGSDVMEWYRAKKAPVVLGHEITGVIDEIGPGVKGYNTGDRVFVSHHVPCNTCRYCLDGYHTACETLHTTNYIPGGFSEYIRVPKINVEIGTFLLPDSMSFEEGTFIEPLACVVRGQRLAAVKPGQTVLILGSGISGLLHLMLARSKDAGRIITTDVSDYRLKTGQGLGADAVINGREDVSKRLRKLNDSRLADMVIVCTSALQAHDQALQSVDSGGTILFFAPPPPGTDIGVPIEKFWRHEIKLMTSYGNSPNDAIEAIGLISSGAIPVKKLITHRLNLNQTPEGFRLVAEAADSVKVIIEPQKTESG